MNLSHSSVLLWNDSSTTLRVNETTSVHLRCFRGSCASLLTVKSLNCSQIGRPIQPRSPQQQRNPSSGLPAHNCKELLLVYWKGGKQVQSVNESTKHKRKKSFKNDSFSSLKYKKTFVFACMCIYEFLVIFLSHLFKFVYFDYSFSVQPTLTLSGLEL